jgi:hypothetical protein
MACFWRSTMPSAAPLPAYRCDWPSATAPCYMIRSPWRPIYYDTQLRLRKLGSLASLREHPEL